MCISSNEYKRNFKINFKENFAKVPIEDWELLGYTHDEAVELSELSVIGSPVEIDQEEIDRIVEAFNNIQEVYPITAKDLEKALERYRNESN